MMRTVCDRATPCGEGPDRGPGAGRTRGRTATCLALLVAAGGTTLSPRVVIAESTSARPDAPPPAPTGVVAAPQSSSAILVTWTPVLDSQGQPVSHYVVYRDGAQVGTPSGATFQDTGLQPNTTYEYEVSAVDAAGKEGKKSQKVSATTLPGGGADTTPPGTPSGLQGSAVAPDQVDLSWQAASDPESGVASYNVYRDAVLVGSPSGTTFSDTGLQPQTTYSYEVSAVNGAGLEGSRSGPLSVTTPTAADQTPPTAPTGLQADAVSPYRIDLAWQAASDPESGVSAYNVYRNANLIASTSATSFADGGLQPRSTYAYAVSAVNGAGLEGSRSASASATTPDDSDTTPPSVPGGLQADVQGPRRVDLVWQAASDPQTGVSSYTVYRDGVAIASVTGTTHTDGSAEPGTTYSYQVAAVNGQGLESARSVAVSATTPAAADTTPPAPPTRLRVISLP